MVTGWRRDRLFQVVYCGPDCLELHNHHDGDEYWLFLGDTPSAERVEKLEVSA